MNLNGPNPLDQIVAGSHLGIVHWRGADFEQHTFCVLMEIWSQLYGANRFRVDTPPEE